MGLERKGFFMPFVREQSGGTGRPQNVVGKYYASTATFSSLKQGDLIIAPRDDSLIIGYTNCEHLATYCYYVTDNAPTISVASGNSLMFITIEY